MRLLLIVLLFIFTSAAHAQQDPLYAQYLFNPLVINPAYAGLDNNMNISAGYRTQWTGLEGHPQTLNASVHTSLVNNKVGAGVLFSSDKVGNITNSETNVSVAYKLNFQETTFSFGMQAGFQNYRTGYSGLNILDPDDNAFAGGERGSRVNIGAGAILKNEIFFIGLSVPRLLPSTFRNGGQEFDLYNQHYYLMGAYVHYLNEHIRLKPAVLFRGVKNAPASVDLAMNVNINALHTAGVFTRNFNTCGFLVQTLMNERFRFGYVFELPTAQSVGSRFTSHEITLGITFSAFDFQARPVSNF
jgi:type IX secretion system PorP/SprF family membrane protein